MPVKTSWARRIRVLPDLLPPVLLFAVVVGSIYAGVATPTEAASLGVVFALGLAAWARTLTLRDPCAEGPRLRVALGPKLAELPAPVTRLKLEAVELTESTGRQLALVQPEGEELRDRLRDGLRQVRASAGDGGVCTVVEVAPWSRIPEQRALLVARDD